MTGDAERALYAAFTQRVLAASFGPATGVGLPVVTLAELMALIQQGIADSCDSERIARRILRRYGGCVLAKVETA